MWNSDSSVLALWVVERKNRRGDGDFPAGDLHTYGTGPLHNLIYNVHIPLYRNPRSVLSLKSFQSSESVALSVNFFNLVILTVSAHTLCVII